MSIYFRLKLCHLICVLSVDSENRIYWHPRASVGKESAWNSGDMGDVGLIPGLGRSSGEGNPLQYSCLENPMDWGAWQATVCGVAKSQKWLNIFTTIKLIMSPFFKQHWYKVIWILIESLLLNSYRRSIVHNSQTRNVFVVNSVD